MSTLYVGTIITRSGLRCLTKKQPDADYVELRLDAMLAARVPLDTLETALKRRRVKVLLTLRRASEGGVYSWKKGERAQLLKQLLPWVDAVDFELASLLELGAAYRQALQAQLVVVLSGHSIKKRVSTEKLCRWVRDFEKKKASVYKLAVRVETARDLFPLALLLCVKPEHRWALMGVGPMAAVSREVLSTLGSRLVYGYLDKPAAPGQPSLKKLRKNSPPTRLQHYA
jgi:3-dehydroquinate dehydratase-1